MRTYSQIKQKQKLVRMVGALLFVLGLANFALVIVSVYGGAHSDADNLRLEIGALWFTAAGAFLGLGRLWGELADMKAQGSAKETDTAS